MSERRTRSAALFVGLLLASSAEAQQTFDRAALDARIDSLVVLHDSAEAELERALEAARRARYVSATALDTQRIGVVTVVSTPDDARVAAAVTERALRNFGAFGTDPSSPFAGLTLLVEDGQSVISFEEMTHRPRHRVVWLPPFTASRRRTGAVVRQLEAELRLPRDLANWHDVDVVFRPDRAQLQSAYRSLIVANSVAVERCRAGDADACGAALGLTGPGPLWSNWYSREELRTWIARQRESYRYEPDRIACYAELRVAQCALLAAAGGGPPAPLPMTARRTLLAYVLARGGVAGYERLRADTTGALVERLARAAGTTPDSLLAGWRAQVIAARPAHAAGLAGTWIVTVLWAVFFSFFAMRSKRWRLG